MSELTYQGAKHGGSHTSITPMAKKVIKVIRRIREVTKISPGLIDRTVRSRGTRVRIKLVQAGMLIEAFNTGSMQELRVYVENGAHDKVIRKLKRHKKLRESQITVMDMREEGG